MVSRAVCTIAIAFSFQTAAEAHFFPDQTPSALKHRYNSKAFNLVKEGKYNQALTLLEDARKKYADDASIYANMGNIYLEKKEPQKAWQYFSRAVKLRKNDGLMWLGLAKAYAECGDKKTALRIAMEQRFRHRNDPRVEKEATCR